MSADPAPYIDESVRLHADGARDHPMVVFGDHSFCAGRSLAVRPMRQPHMHSQVELNLVLHGAMTYWFDGRALTLTTGRLALFWGMVPHQVTDASEAARFVCLYLPMSLFLGLRALKRMHEAIFAGSIIEAREVRPYEIDIFLRWREELMSGDPAASELVREELCARLRRLDREGWRDLRPSSRLAAPGLSAEPERLVPVETMARYIAEHAREPIAAADVARASGLHPNYAMQLYRRAVGMSIKQSITRFRLDAAQSMLIASDRPVAAIAFECGFGSLSSFYAAFEKRFRNSPTDLRHRFATRAAFDRYPA